MFTIEICGFVNSYYAFFTYVALKNLLIKSLICAMCLRVFQTIKIFIRVLYVVAMPYLLSTLLEMFEEYREYLLCTLDDT